MIEVWKDIKGYEGLYQVSNFGNVKSLVNYHRKDKERILRPGIQKSGHLMLTLCKEGKHKHHLIHRLVAETFIPNPLKLPYINHKDENPSNNCVDNLEWCTQKYNVNYGTAIKRSTEKRSIPIYCVELNKVFPSIREASRITGVNQGNLTQCLKGKCYKSAGGFHWRYV